MKMTDDEREAPAREISDKSSLAPIFLAAMHNARPPTRSGKERRCLDCGQVLSSYNLGFRCHACAEKRMEAKVRAKA